jgi:hypothetical protein
MTVWTAAPDAVSEASAATDGSAWDVVLGCIDVAYAARTMAIHAKLMMRAPLEYPRRRRLQAKIKGRRRIPIMRRGPTLFLVAAVSFISVPSGLKYTENRISRDSL